MADIDTSKEAVAAKVSLMRHKAFREVGGFLQTDRGLAENADLIEALSRDLEAMRAERDHWRNTAMNKLELMDSTALRAKDAEIAMLQARVAELEEAIKAAIDASKTELNLGNYDHDDVCALQAEALEIWAVLTAALSREGGE